MHQHSSFVAGGASWHTVRAFSNGAVVVEKRSTEQSGAGMRGPGEYAARRRGRAQFFRRVKARSSVLRCALHGASQEPHTSIGPAQEIDLVAGEIEISQEIA